MSLVAVAGQLVQPGPTAALLSAEGFTDGFNRTGLVDNGWTDMASVMPFHDPCSCVGGRLATSAGASKGQFGVYRSRGAVDDMEVTAEWQFGTTDLSDVGWQPGPAIFVDGTGNQGEMGLVLYYDITFASTGSFFGLWGLFDQPDFLTPAHYVTYDSNFLASSVGVGFTDPASNTLGQLTLRVVDGFIEGRFNGERVVGPVPVPSWAVGRDGWGCNVVEAPTPIPLTGDIGAVRIRPYNTPLGSYPVVTVNTPGATVKASTAASVAVAYPTVTAGDLLVAAVTTINGTFSTPSEWTARGNATISGGIHVRLYSKTATGSETGSQTFLRT